MIFDKMVFDQENDQLTSEEVKLVNQKYFNLLKSQAEFNEQMNKELADEIVDLRKELNLLKKGQPSTLTYEEDKE